MKQTWKYFKNKFILATTIFMVYALFLDENDIFTIVIQNHKLQKLQEAKLETSLQLKETKSTLARLKYSSELERFAREEKLFKKDNEDIFVIFKN